MTDPIVRWFPGMKLSEVERQIIISAQKYFPTLDTAAIALGISLTKLKYKLAEIKRENEEEEREMDALVAGTNEAILRFKRMAAGATVAQEKKEWEKTVREEKRLGRAANRK